MHQYRPRKSSRRQRNGWRPVTPPPTVNIDDILPMLEYHGISVKFVTTDGATFAEWNSDARSKLTGQTANELIFGTK